MKEENIEQKIQLLTQFLTECRLERMKKVLSYRTRYISVVLEDIYQSHNASAVLRSCDAFGVQDVHVLQERNTFTPNQEVSLGSSKWLTLHQYTKKPVADVYAKLRQRGYKIIATALQEDATPPHKINIEERPIALVFGSELNGLTDEAIEHADETMYIPMVGFVESFNISVSVAIVLSQLMPKVRALGDIWHLSETEKQEILLEWLRSDVHRSKEIESKCKEEE